MSYDKKARQYEQKWRKYLQHTHDQLLTLFACQSNDRILDVSAGTGLFAQHLIASGRNFGSLVLNDTSYEMLAIARARLKEEKRVSFTESPAEDLKLPDNHFDVVVSLNAFHHYKNQEKALGEVAHVLRPGGTFYVLDWDKSGYFRIVNALIKAWVQDPIHTCSSDEMRKKLTEHSFDVSYSKKWRFSYWKLFMYQAEKGKIKR